MIIIISPSRLDEQNVRTNALWVFRNKRVPQKFQNGIAITPMDTLLHVGHARAQTYRRSEVERPVIMYTEFTYTDVYVGVHIECVHSITSR